jgi:hypothetical protein
MFDVDPFIITNVDLDVVVTTYTPRECLVEPGKAREW